MHILRYPVCKSKIVTVGDSQVQYLKSKANYARFVEQLLAQTPNPKVLIVGGGIVGEALEEALNHPDITFIESDVAFGPRTAVICDAYDIPFDYMVFDGVIAGSG